MRRALAAALIASSLGVGALAQQLPDKAFAPRLDRPAWARGAGPRLCLDESHHNFHTLDDRFWAFAELARRDGYRVGAVRQPFSREALAACDLLVIANAQPDARDWNEYPSPTPSAFAPAEIATLTSWVAEGKSLLLIADHMPLAGAAAALAAAFGATFVDGFAFKQAPAGADAAAVQAARRAPTLFRQADGTLADHPIVRGREPAERITQVRSFTGQAFQLAGEGSESVLVLPADFVSLEPRTAWQFTPDTPSRPVGGWLQGATRRVGKGRVAFFGEAAMFTAQVAGAARTPMGMNAPQAEQNAQFVLNVLHWLSAIL